MKRPSFQRCPSLMGMSNSQPTAGGWCQPAKQVPRPFEETAGVRPGVGFEDECVELVKWAPLSVTGSQPAVRHQGTPCARSDPRTANLVPRTCWP